jgi:hypothetical protein
MRVPSCSPLLVALAVLLPRPAAAAPDDTPHLRLRLEAHLCPLRGAVCVRAVPPTSGDNGLFADAEPTGSAPVPSFSRERSDDATPWLLDVDASLRRLSWAGNALFLLYDAEDAQAIASHEVTALYQASIGSVRSVSARLRLDPNDGFRPAHTYLLRIAQLIEGNEVILAEGPIVLR